MPGFWHQCRIAFRCARFAVWAAVLLALAAFAWFNLVGLPGFLKTRLVTALHQRGVELEFSRMRLRIIHGLICDNVRIGGANDAAGPVLTAREMQLRVNFPALLRLRWQVDGLVLRNGNFSLPLSPTNALALTNLQSEVRFAADDTWALDQFRAQLHGVNISLGAEIAHAPECRNWKIFTGTQSGDHGGTLAALNHFSRTLEQIHFHGLSQLNARLNGDARDVHSFTLILNSQTPAVQTPWFAVEDLQFAARLTAPADAPTNSDPALGFWTNLQPFQLAWTAHGTNLQSARLNASAVDCDGGWSAPELAVTRLSARLGGGELRAAVKLDVGTRELSFTNQSTFDLHAVAALLTEKTRERLAEIAWTAPPTLRASGALVLPAWTNSDADWHDDVEPSVRLHGELAFTNAVADDLVPLDSARTHFSYENLIWQLPDLELVQGRTKLALSIEESEATKNFQCAITGRVDADAGRSFLTTSNAQRGFGLLTFHEPLALNLNVSGNLRDFAQLSATGRVAVTNFAVRGETFESVAADLVYTNLVVDFLQPQMLRAGGSQTMTADAVALDFNARMIFFTNGFSTTAPLVVCRAIGPKTARTVEPYEFLSPPTVQAFGRLPLRDINGGLDLNGTDLRFDIIRGAPFRWTMVHAADVTGTVHWLGQELILTNVVANLYGGLGCGNAYFDFHPVGYGCDFNFNVALTNVDVRQFAEDFPAFKTNQLAGSLTGQAVVTTGKSLDRNTWNGYGSAQLRNGLLWNFPIFGFVSPVLNTITPGLDMGNSRATDGSGRFTMTNGVVFTDSLDIRSLTMRVQYVGTVDLYQNVSARARAQLLRNTPVIGSLFSTVLWPVSKAFECDVTGTLAQPKITPAYLPFPKLLTAPLHPIRSMEEMFAAPPTNAPAGKP